MIHTFYLVQDADGQATELDTGIAALLCSIVCADYPSDFAS